jgi:hypothetical protein
MVDPKYGVAKINLGFNENSTAPIETDFSWHTYANAGLSHEILSRDSTCSTEIHSHGVGRLIYLYDARLLIRWRMPSNRIGARPLYQRRKLSR